NCCPHLIGKNIECCTSPNTDNTTGSRCNGNRLCPYGISIVIVILAEQTISISAWHLYPGNKNSCLPCHHFKIGNALAGGLVNGFTVCRPEDISVFIQVLTVKSRSGDRIPVIDPENEISAAVISYCVNCNLDVCCIAYHQRIVGIIGPLT